MSGSNRKRLRVFAGPKGSGKSTLFSKFSRKYDPGIFVNAMKLKSV
jgi:predicted ABC-type ATPase